MAYRFAQEREDYSALASGQVLHSLPGQTAFPVRLASEVFQRCAAHLAAAGVAAPYRVFDPVCGGAQLLATLRFLHGDAIRERAGSDVDPEAARLAERNLALLTLPGLDARIAALAALHDRYGKESHAAAAAHAMALRQRLAGLTQHHQIKTRVFQADATRPDALRGHVAPQTADLVIADVPYGQRSSWHGEASPLPGSSPAATPPEVAPVWRLLAALPPMAPMGVVAVAASKGQPVQHERYRRLAQLHLGKRKVTLLTALSAST